MTKKIQEAPPVRSGVWPIDTAVLNTGASAVVASDALQWNERLSTYASFPWRRNPRFRIGPTPIIESFTQLLTSSLYQISTSACSTLSYKTTTDYMRVQHTLFHSRFAASFHPLVWTWHVPLIDQLCVATPKSTNTRTSLRTRRTFHFSPPSSWSCSSPL